MQNSLTHIIWDITHNKWPSMIFLDRSLLPLLNAERNVGNYFTQSCLFSYLGEAFRTGQFSKLRSQSTWAIFFFRFLITAAVIANTTYKILCKQWGSHLYRFYLMQLSVQPTLLMNFEVIFTSTKISLWISISILSSFLLLSMFSDVKSSVRFQHLLEHLWKSYSTYRLLWLKTFCQQILFDDFEISQDIKDRSKLI